MEINGRLRQYDKTSNMLYWSVPVIKLLPRFGHAKKLQLDLVRRYVLHERIGDLWTYIGDVAAEHVTLVLVDHSDREIVHMFRWVHDISQIHRG